MQEEVKQNRPYKIMVGDTIRVFRREVDYNGKTLVFYSTPIKKKEYDGTFNYYYKNIKFRKGVDLQNKCTIKINNMFEDVSKNTKDNYNPIWSLFISDYELVEESSSDTIIQYNKQIQDDFGENIEITSEDLPF